MLIVLLLLLCAVAAAALALLWLVVRGHNKRLLLAGSHAVASDTPDGIGISVLCSGVRAQEQVENLLSAEYAHYEVIVVLDSCVIVGLRPTARYRMIRVECTCCRRSAARDGRAGAGAFAQAPFRRLVLVDRAQDSAGDFDAAAEGRLRLRAAGAGGQFCCRTLSRGWWPKWWGRASGAIACVRGSESLPRC